MSGHRGPAALPSSLQNSYQLRCLFSCWFWSLLLWSPAWIQYPAISQLRIESQRMDKVAWKWRAAAQSLFGEICCTSVACGPPLLCNSLHQQNPFSRTFTFITCLAHPYNSLIRTLSAPHPLLMVASVECILAKALSTSSAWAFSYQAHHLGNNFIPQLYFGFRDFIPGPFVSGSNHKAKHTKTVVGAKQN